MSRQRRSKMFEIERASRACRELATFSASMQKHKIQIKIQIRTSTFTDSPKTSQRLSKTKLAQLSFVSSILWKRWNPHQSLAPTYNRPKETNTNFKLTWPLKTALLHQSGKACVRPPNQQGQLCCQFCDRKTCELKWRPAKRSEKMPQIEWFRACSNCPAGSSEHKVDHGSNDQLSKLKELRFRFLKLMQGPNFLIWYLAVDAQSLVDQYPEIWKHTAPPQSLGPIKQWTCRRPAFPQYTFKFSIPVDI